ncbi:MAG: hypothetical protein NTV32_10660 [Gammaproteobacteria bacterium]|nr:hypothetical protein [Gammaproteobacteria bacterium]
MTNEDRMKKALILLGNNLRGSGFDAMKPISVGLANQFADLAFAIAEGKPHEQFDELCKQAGLI